MRPVARIRVLIVALIVLCPAIALCETTGVHQGLSLGTIDFPTSGSGEAERAFVTGVLAMHSFWYPEARDHFRRARELDPDYAMAYWGEAMSHDHPIWRRQNRRSAAEVLSALDERIANGTVHWTERERAYVRAARTLFCGRVLVRRRRRAYADEMAEIALQYPHDTGAAALAALADMTVPGFDDEDPTEVEPIAAVLEGLHEQNATHPGALHYLIHLYDSKTYAARGMEPALAYASIAGSASHAVHMPSHIYRQLGMWRKVRESNERAYQVSVRWQERTGRPLKDRDFHAYQWLFDAHVALGRIEEAKKQIRDLEEMLQAARTTGEATGSMRWLRRYFRRQLRRARVCDTDP